MQTIRSTTCLALASTLGLCGLLAPATVRAGDIGYFKEGDCATTAGDYAARIANAGHTPVALGDLSPASLAPLDGLVLAQGCNATFSGISAAVDDAVANGMSLFLQVQDIPLGSTATLRLPGLAALAVSDGCSLDVSLAAGSPIASGPGGSVEDSNLDNPSLCGLTGWADASALPAGSTRLLVDATVASNVGAFAYAYGNGRVVLSMDQIMYSMTGGRLATSHPRAGSDAYITNTIAWLMPKAPIATCASEGYTGTKLTWCRNICEMGYTGATLDMWIHRWINRYRDLPYCAQEGGGEEEPPPQET